MENIPVDPFAPLTAPSPSVVPVGPAREPADSAALRAMAHAELCAEILARLATAEQRPLEELEGEPKHEDGSVAIDSMTAVSVLASIGGTVGKPKLVDLSKADPCDLRSIAGLARIAQRALMDLPAEAS